MDALSVAVLVVFIGTYLVISTEKVNRMGMSLLGMATVGIVLWFSAESGHPDGTDFHHLVMGIEWDTILFIICMMIIVSVAGGSGMFQYLALKLARPSGGNHKKLFTTFIIFVFIISLFLDTTSTMLIMAPLTIEVCQALEIDFKPYLVSESIVCNFASIPSVVGAVPNLVIAGVTNLDAGLLFVAFMPLSIILLVVTLPLLLRYYSSSFGTTDEHRVEAVFRIDPETMIISKTDFIASVVAFCILVLGFAIGPIYNFAPAMIALFVAAFLLILAHEEVSDFLSQIGWETVFFLVGLFGLVVALGQVHLIDNLATLIGEVIGNNAVIATVFMVWIPAMLSAFLDNLPVSAVLAPIAVQFASVSVVLPLALVFAVNVGGYLFTPLGSPANMVSMGCAEKEHDPISFKEFAKIGTILGLIHLTIGTGWLLLLGLFLG